MEPQESPICRNREGGVSAKVQKSQIYHIREGSVSVKPQDSRICRIREGGVSAKVSAKALKTPCDLLASTADVVKSTHRIPHINSRFAH